MEAIFQIESRDTFEKVLQCILKSLFYSAEVSNTQIEPDIIEKAKEEIRANITESNFNIQKVIEKFRNKFQDKERFNYVTKLLEQNWSDILVAALNNYNIKHGESVVNFDWQVKYVLGTSELKTLKYPLLQLTISTAKKSGKHSQVMYDINKDVLEKLINVLENV